MALTGESGETESAGLASAPATPPPAGPPLAEPARAARPAAGAAPPPRPQSPVWWGIATALGGGLLLAAAFPPVGVWPLAPFGPALLVLALWRRGARASFGLGLIFGLAFFVPLLSWLINLAWYAWAALAIAEALIFALLCLGQQLLLRWRAWPVTVAAWWVSAEALRDRWPYAFPWGRLAMSQAGAPSARWTAVGGPPLLSLLIAATGTTLAWALLTRTSRRAASPASAPRRRDGSTAGAGAATPAGTARRLLPVLALLAVAGLTAAGRVLPADPQPPSPRTAVVAAIQGDVPHARDLPNLLRASTVTANHAQATERLAAEVHAGALPAPDLVIWPENSTDLDPRLYPPIRAEIAAATRAIARPVLVGEVLQAPLRNVGQLWTPQRGPGPVYVKRQLVPFGEYIPFRGLLSHVTSLVALQPHDFTPGHRVVVFRAGQIRLGDVICYEVGFDNLVASEVTAGANLLSVQTNDATFEVDGQRGETLQQLAMARIRAIEYDRAMVVASTTGVSAVIGPDGQLIARGGTWRAAELDARVPLLTYRTLAARAGPWPEYVITALALAALAAAAAAAVTRRRRVTPL